MKKYKFKVKKIITNTIEFDAKDYKEAFSKLMEYLAIGDKEIFENSEDREVSYDVILEKNNNQNDMKLLKMIKEILEKIDEIDEEFEENEEEIEENLPQEYIEVVCDKCGHCIKVDEDDLFSE